MMSLPYIIHYIFQAYILLIMARVIGSWFPRFAASKAMRFVAFYTDPYLNLFRRLIPPIGGTLDLSPLIGFFVLRIGESIVIRMIF